MFFKNDSIHFIFEGGNTGLTIYGMIVKAGGNRAIPEYLDLQITHDFLEHDDFDLYEKLIADPWHYMQGYAKHAGNITEADKLIAVLRVEVGGDLDGNFDHLHVIDQAAGYHNVYDLNVDNVNLTDFENVKGDICYRNVTDAMYNKIIHCIDPDILIMLDRDTKRIS